MTTHRNDLAAYLYRLAGADLSADLADAELLDRFERSGDPAAFAELVRRHGPIVYGVCARVLNNSIDAEDAFQAAFIALADGVGTLDRCRPLAGWLHSVAYRIALNVRRSRYRLLKLESRISSMSTTEPPDDLVRRELSAVLDEELGRLPGVERDLLVLCDMQGRTQAEAAAAVGRPIGSVARLLSAARGRLRDRLARRGVEVPAAVLAAALAGGASAVPEQVQAEAVRVALLRAGASIAGAVPVRAAELAQQLVRGAALGRLKAAALVTVAALVGLSAVVFFGPRPDPANRLDQAPGGRTDGGPGGEDDGAGGGLYRHGAAVTALAVSADGRRVASAAADRGVRVWDAETGRELNRFTGPVEGVTALAFGPNGQELVAEDHLAGLAVWRLDTGKRRKNPIGQAAGVDALAYSPDGNWLVSVGRDGRRVLIDVPRLKGGEPPWPRDWAEKEQEAKFWVRLALAFVPRAAVRGGGAGHAVAVTPDGRFAHVVDRNLKRTRVDVGTGAEAALGEPAGRAPAQPVTAVAVAPDGTVAWGAAGHRVGVCGAEAGAAPRFFRGHRAAVVALAFAPDGRSLASADAAGRLIHWTLDGGDGRSLAAPFQAGLLAFAPDGRRLYAAGAGGEVRCWEVPAVGPLVPLPKK